MSVEPIKGVLSAYTNPLYGTLASELLRGYSAYNIAVMEGYEGTIDEWLESLIGPKGDKGDQGDPGLDGEQGPRGYTGETGPKGDKGDQGDKGDTGNGIYAVVLRADYTLSIYFTDGSVYNTPSIRGREGAVGPAGPVGPQGETGAKGDKGDTGDAGTGISSIVQNADHSLTINLDDGTSYTTDPVEALKGDKGDTGNGISSIVMKSDYTLQINMTNGSSYNTPSIRGVAGAKGDKGDKGDTGATGPQGPKGDPGALNFHICSQTEYDSTTRVPTVQNPEDDTFYLVPSASVTSPDLFVEWIYVNNAWEMFGSATVDLTQIEQDIDDLKSNLQQKYEKPSGGIPASDLAQGVIPDVPVTDVKVNGTSVLNNGVADLPLATDIIAGVVKILSANGIRINSSGQLEINYPTDTQIKNGSAYFRPIVPALQEKSTFYGLAKAAGDTTQSQSSNAVGMYTDAAKVAIQKMLGIYEAPWEIIRSDTFTHTESADYIIEVDNNGESFNLTDLYLEVWLDALSDDSAVHGNYGRVDFYYDSTNYYSAYLNEKTISVGSYRSGAYVLLKKENGAVYKINSSYATMGSDRVSLTSTGRVDQNRALMMMIDVTWKKVRITSIKGIVHYILYGKRKWS